MRVLRFRMVAVKNSIQPPAGALALGADNYRQRIESGRDQRRRRYDLIGQQDRLLWQGL